MEKLIELLNEYVEKYNKSDLDYTFELDKDNWLLFCYDDTTDHKWWTMQDEAMVICSKQFWFIERLIQKDKVDTFRILEKRFDTQKWNEREHYHTVNEWNTDLLLMLLAISDTPIEDLISYLK